MATLVLAIGLGLLAWRIHWDSKHPAAGTARKIHSGDVGERIAAIQQLANIGKEDAEVAIPALVSCLGDPDAGVRAAAAMGLASVIQVAGSAGAAQNEVRNAVRALIGTLKDPQPPVRADAAQALWMVAITSTGPAPVIDRAQVVGALIDAAGDPDDKVRLSAIRGLGAIGPGASDDPPPVLVAAIEDPSDPIRAAASFAIVHYRQGLFRLIPALVRSMELAGPQVRARYVEIFESIKPPKFSADVVPALTTALRSGDAEIRYLAVNALATFKKDAKSAVPALLKCLDDRRDTRPAVAGTRPTNHDPLVAVAETLGQLAPPTDRAGEAIAGLAKVLKSGGAGQRAAAAAALGRFPVDPMGNWSPGRSPIGHADPLQLAALTEALGDAEIPVRAASLHALHNVGMKTAFESSPALKTALARAMEDPSPKVRTQAAAAIAHSGRVIDQLFPTVVRHGLHDPDREVREMCAGVVSLTSGPVAATVTPAMIPALVEALAGREQGLRWSACHSLARFGPKAAPAIPALLRVVRDYTETPDQIDDNIVELLVQLAVGTPRAAEVIAALTDLLRREPMPRRRAAADALGSFGPSAAPAVPTLVATLREAIDTHQIRPALWMAAALGRIEPAHASAREIIPLLVDVLESGPAEHHRDAAKAARAFGPAAASTVPGLVAMLKRSVVRETPYGTRTVAAEALGRIAPGTLYEESAVQALTESLRTRAELVQNDPHDDKVVVDALARFGPKAAAAIVELKKLEAVPDPELIEAVRKALAAIAVAPRSAPG